MKYRDPETGEFKELYTKAADTLPVGTIVEYEGTETPAGWELVETSGTGIKRIKKKEPSVGILGKIINSLTNSEQDTYSADYLNKKIEVVTVTEAGTDLDDYTEIGVYFFNSSYTPTNIPEGSDGWLVVYNNNYGSIKQVWYRMGSVANNSFHTFVRTCGTNGVWSDWVKLIDERDIYYKGGNTFELSKDLIGGGYISSGATTIYFSITVPKRLDNINSITLNSLNITIRGITGYLLEKLDKNNFDGTITLTKTTENTILIALKKNTAFESTNDAFESLNNTPVGFEINSMNLTFNE